MFLREEVVKMLKEDVCVVKFIKKDGSERIMKATLKEEILKPYVEGVTSTSSKKQNPNQVSCIDTEKNAWRSFTLDSIISIEKDKE